jgi:hypothetical protein
MDKPQSNGLLGDIALSRDIIGIWRDEGSRPKKGGLSPNTMQLQNKVKKATPPPKLWEQGKTREETKTKNNNKNKFPKH